MREYSADATRIALADAGDTMDDANFDYKVANSAILRLTKELAWVEEVLAAVPSLRTGQALFADKAFANEMNRAVHSTREVSRGALPRTLTSASSPCCLLAVHVPSLHVAGHGYSHCQTCRQS